MYPKCILKSVICILNVSLFVEYMLCQTVRKEA